MTEDTQCETMGLQATGLTNPLDRFMPPPTLKRKAPSSTTSVEETIEGPKKICIEVAALENMFDDDKENHQTSILAKTLQQPPPKVIVQHSPLPSIYELQQISSSACDSNFDSGVSDESGSDESDEEEPPPPPPPPPPASVPQPQQPERYWNNQQSFGPKRQSPFGFLEQTDQRIECAENGKSYLQLGTMSHHHHIPVTPVIQPKTYYHRRPPFRNNPIMPRPICDHSNCLQRKSSFCYRNHRTRMLNVSLHKLHLARQNHEGSLRRSVLICNMLRYIEDETEKEAHLHENQHFNGSLHNTSDDVYSWNDHYNGSAGNHHQQHQQQPPQHSPMPGQTSPPYDTYEMTLKDFNSAFRSTPYSSPSHPGIEVDSVLDSPEGDAINWSSVLNLSSGSALDPLNNNTTFGNSGQNVPLDSWSVTTNSCTNNKSEDGFEDIGWKLSADDVLKAFPNDEHIFVGP